MTRSRKGVTSLSHISAQNLHLLFQRVLGKEKKNEMVSRENKRQESLDSRGGL